MGRGLFDEMGSTRVSWRWFFIMISSAQVAGVMAVILLAVLLGQYRGGFEWTVSSCRSADSSLSLRLSFFLRMWIRSSIIIRCLWPSGWFSSMVMVSWLKINSAFANGCLLFVRSYSGLSRLSRCEEDSREDPSCIVTGSFLDLFLDRFESGVWQSQFIQTTERQSLFSSFVGWSGGGGFLRFTMGSWLCQFSLP